MYQIKPDETKDFEHTFEHLNFKRN